MPEIIHHTHSDIANPVPVVLMPNLNQGFGSFEGLHDREGVLVGAKTMKLLVDAKHEARTDGLTNLPNRLGFDEGLDRLVSSVVDDEEPRLAMLFIDLDNFKKVNDEHKDKHAAGDLVLKSVSEILRLNLKLRDDEIVGRLGGDEFAAGIRTKVDGNNRRDPNMTDQQVEDGFIDRIVEDVAKLAESIGMESLGVSIGVVEYRKGETKEQFMARADREMYKIKEARKKQEKRQTVGRIGKMGRAIISPLFRKAA